jgi:hypothetical protein
LESFDQRKLDLLAGKLVFLFDDGNHQRDGERERIAPVPTQR